MYTHTFLDGKPLVKLIHSSDNFEDTNIKIHPIQLDNAKRIFDL